MDIKGAKVIPRCFCSKPATFQPSTIIADIISHSLLSFSENFPMILKSGNYLRCERYFRESPK